MAIDSRHLIRQRGSTPTFGLEPPKVCNHFRQPCQPERELTHIGTTQYVTRYLRSTELP